YLKANFAGVPVRPSWSEDSPKPLVVYEVSETSEVRTKDSNDLCAFQVLMDVIGKDYTQSRKVANSLVQALEGLEGYSGAGFEVLYARNFSSNISNDRLEIGFITTVTFELLIHQV
ncbi:hypothetical protein RZS08_29130, partial [Arthrospira platensis SPKY1]|nr:hypothetical protein [Arthrospira platensis SPKY1]